MCIRDSAKAQAAYDNIKGQLDGYQAQLDAGKQQMYAKGPVSYTHLRCRRTSSLPVIFLMVTVSPAFAIVRGIITFHSLFHTVCGLLMLSLIHI